jgi:hypothetical protein
MYTTYNILSESSGSYSTTLESKTFGMVPGGKEESVENGGYRHRSIRWQTQFYTVHITVGNLLENAT